MARLLFCALGNDGFLQPLAAIAERLQRRGHHVAFVASKADEGKLAARGLSRIPRGTTDGSSFEMATWSHPYSIAMQVKHLHYGMSVFAPDVIVSHQLSIAPVILRASSDVPLCVLGIAAYIWPASAGASGDTLPSPREVRVRWQHDDLLRILNRALDVISLKPVEVNDFTRTPFAGDCFLLQSVPELCRDLDALPEQVRFVGSCVSPLGERCADLDAWLANAAPGKPLVYVQGSRSFGAPNFLPPVLEALERLDVDVVASVGRFDGDGITAAGRHFVRDHVPQEAVLGRASLFIGAGHTTGTLGAIASGVPCLLFPSGSGTVDISERFEMAGAARTVWPDRYDSAAVADDVSVLLGDASYRAAARGLAAAFSRYDGPELCARAILDVHAARVPVAARA